MNTSTQSSNNTNNGMPNAAYIFVAVGGGVVGQDYAQWMQVDPFIGAIIGGIISTILTKFLLHLYADPNGDIRNTFSKIGGVAGVIFGCYAVGANTEGFEWLIGAIIFGGIGAWMGQMFAATLSLAALILLVLSQGPVGMFVRAIITNVN